MEDITNFWVSFQHLFYCSFKLYFYLLSLEIGHLLSQNVCMCFSIKTAIKEIGLQLIAWKIRTALPHSLRIWARCFLVPLTCLCMSLIRRKPACVCVCAHASSVNLEPQHYSSSHGWRRVALAATMSSWVPPSVLMCIVGNACSPDSVTAVHSHRITSWRYSPPPFTYTSVCVFN